MGRVEYLNDPSAPKPNRLVPACGTLAVNDKGEILLQRRLDTGQWALPMGKQEIGETPSQCAIRETFEETGVLVEITGIIGIYSDPGHVVAYTDGEIRQEYEVTLLARPVSGTVGANDEASEAGWFPPDRLAGFRPTDEERDRYRTGQRDAVLRALGGYNPTAMAVFDVDTGHTDPQWILPYGGSMTVDGPARRIIAHY